MTRIPIAEVYRRSVSWTSTFMRIGFYGAGITAKIRLELIP